jgi:release factor glutamine methyltransferase
MTQLASALAAAAAALAVAGFEEPRRRARRILAAALDLSPAVVVAHPERALSAPEADRVRAVLDRVLAHEPLSRILGHREFWGLYFALNRDTLDPRPETETVVEAVLRRLPDRRAPLHLLDLGTGSGAILLALLSECPAARGLGIDIAPGAAAAARDNAVALGILLRANFVVGDWAAAAAGRFDAVVANPPYIATGALAGLPPEVARWDPARALDGGADGLGAYRAIAADLPRLLLPGGLFACEIGEGQEAAVMAILAAAGLAVDAVEPDLAGIARVVVARHV